MEVTDFGASGRTGRQVVGQGLERRHEITAVVRDASRFGMSSERLRVVEGDARDLATVAGAGHG